MSAPCPEYEQRLDNSVVASVVVRGQEGMP